MIALLRLARCERGSPTMEFAILCPVLLMVLLGLSDLVYQGYMQDVLTGAVQKAGRDSSIQYADTGTIDSRVEAPVRAVSATAQFEPSRESYTNYSQIAPEPFTDNNKNGKRDKNECYQDINGNGQWDADPGATGQGGAGDVTYYTMKVTFPRLFPFGAYLPWGDMITISASTILKNQPYAAQVVAPVQTLCN